jgi:hypothetical protein
VLEWVFRSPPKPEAPKQKRPEAASPEPDQSRVTAQPTAIDDLTISDPVTGTKVIELDARGLITIRDTSGRTAASRPGATQIYAPEWFIDSDGSVHVFVAGSTDGTTTFVFKVGSTYWMYGNYAPVF